MVPLERKDIADPTNMQIVFLMRGVSRRVLNTPELCSIAEAEIRERAFPYVFSLGRPEGT